jgi:tetratricopeptide (TPR) repeat protein
MGALYGFDKFLAAQEQSELWQEAHDHYLDGQKLLHAGNAKAAVIAFARAHALERSDREYSLALATAQLADHDLTAASDNLTELLDTNSNEGRANLLMAQVLVAQNHLDDADAFYHRAIYGVWPASAQDQPARVRLELARLLADHGRNRELLSELLLLQNIPAQAPATQKQIADLFLQAGSPARAIEAYRQLVHENPVDIDAYLGLGRAEILAGDYRAAETAVMSALRRKPYDEQIQAELRRVVQLASLDPTVRHLTTAEKYRRSAAILTMVQNKLNACAQNAPPTTISNSQKGTPPVAPQGPVSSETAEALLDHAEVLWKQRPPSCSVPAGDPLPLLFRKLS